MKTEIHLLNIKDRLNSPVDEYLKFFSPERQEAVLRYKNLPDRNRTLWADLFARRTISKFTGKNFDEIKILRLASGKPYCEISEVFFSLSHSGEWIACSVGDVENGVDVESEDRKISLSVAEKFFLPHEFSNLRDLYYSGVFWQRRFFCYWTLKESYLKCMNINNWSGVDSVKLLSGHEEISGCNFVLNDKYILGCCTAREAIPKNFQIDIMCAEEGNVNL